MSVTKVTVNGMDMSSDVTLSGTTPTLTIGDAGAEDAAIVFDGNAQDFHIGLDDTADDLVIGKGSALGTTTAVSIDEDLLVTTHGGITMAGTTPTLTIGDAGAEDAKIVFDGNAQDFHIGLDDTADSLAIGLGSALGTTDHMVFDATGAVTKPLQPSFYAWNSGAQTFTSSATTEIEWTSERHDTNADFDPSAERFTAPVAGVYLFHAKILFTSLGTTDAGRISLYLYKNGSLYDDLYREQGASGVSIADNQTMVHVDSCVIEKAAADDYYELFLYHTTSSDSLTIGYTQGYGSFAGVLLG